MKRFLKRVFVFLLPLLLAALGFLVWNHRYIASPRVTNSCCLNEKMYRSPREPLDVLAVGSSMTLCNLESSTLVEGLGNPRFYNFANWGFSIEDIRYFTPLLADQYRPSMFIISSNVVDFRPRDLEYDIDEVRSYLKLSSRWSAYLKHADLKYYIENTADNRENRRSLNIYSSLLFDSWGGIALEKEGFQIRPQRWGKGVSFDLLDEAAYGELETICRMLKKRSIKLVFVLSPLREGLVDEAYRQGIVKHSMRVRQIVESAGGIFIDSTRSVWPDEMFVDGTHLHAEGGRRLSNMVLDALAAEK
jgi:hypothetical protein